MRHPPSPAIRAVCGLLLTSLAVWNASADTLPTTAYGTSDGLPHPHVRKILPDSRGFIWFCTRRGLSRFDGGQFVTYGVADGLPSESVMDFIETSRGEYWVATNGGGVCRLNTDRAGNRPRERSRFTDCVRGDTPESRRVNALYEDRAGRLWAGSDGGLFRLHHTARGTTLERVELNLPDRPDRALQIWEFAEEPAGTMWVGTSAGLAKRVDGTRAIQYRIQPLRGADHVFALLVDAHQRIWIGHGTGLIVFRPGGVDPAASGHVRQLPLAPAGGTPQDALPHRAGEAVRFTTSDGLSGPAVLALHQSSDREVWIGTSRGMSRFDGQRLIPIAAGHAIQDVSAIAEDRGHRIWTGGERGAVRLARAGFVRYTVSDGLSNDVVRSVFETEAGVLHVVTRRALIHRFDGARFKAIRPNLSRDGRILETVPPGLFDRAGEWWVPGEAGLYRFARTATLEDLARIRPKAIYTARDGLAGDDIFGLFEDSRGDIWVARRAPTGAVLTRWDRATGTFHRYFASDGLPAFTRPTVFGEDRAGNVWVGFFGAGIARHRDGRFTLFTSTDGVPGGSITAIFSDSKGRLWIGASPGGVGRVDDPGAPRPRFARYTAAEGLTNSGTHSITSDHAGRLYFGTFSGIDRLDPATGLVRHYALPDELAGTEVEVAYCDRRGTLWFGTYQGLVSLIPGEDRQGARPAMRIGGLRIAGQPQSLPEFGEEALTDIALDAHQNHLQVDFFSISTESPVRYQYKLEGADRDWSGPTPQRSVTFANLAPGRYRFLVRAVSVDGLTSAPASVALQIYPPVWHRWWFVTGAGLLVALAAYALHRIRLVRLLELERVRMRIATDLHDDIGSSLTQIAILSEVAERRMQRPDPAVAEPISRVSVISRELVDSMSEIVWAINPRNDRLQDLASRMRRFAADVLSGRQIALRFRAPDEAHSVAIDTDLRRHAFLVFKEVVHNAVRHSGCTEVDVDIGSQNRRLVLVVHDNGRGFDRRQATGGQGLRSMEARANSLDGQIEIVSAPDQGTTVRVIIPLTRRTAGRRQAS
jgi:ligand-binding sensor domain-containing protein/two-component sensor histidine kinase